MDMERDYTNFLRNILEDEGTNDYTKIQFILKSLTDERIQDSVRVNDDQALYILANNFFNTSKLSTSSQNIVTFLKALRCVFQKFSSVNYNFFNAVYKHEKIQKELKRNQEELSLHISELCKMVDIYVDLLPLFFQDSLKLIIQNTLPSISDSFEKLNPSDQQKVLHFIQTNVIRSRLLSGYLENIFKGGTQDSLELFSYIIADGLSHDKIFGLILKASLALKQLDEAFILKLFIFLCHLIQVEQNINFEAFNRSLLAHLQVDVVKIDIEDQLTVLKELLTVFSHGTTNLHVEIVEGVSGLQFFQKLALYLITLEPLGSKSVECWTLMVKIDPVIVEGNMKKILTRVFTAEPFLWDAVLKFFTESVRAFANFHRVLSFVKKFLTVINFIPDEFDLQLEKTEFKDIFSKHIATSTLGNNLKLLNTLTASVEGVLESSGESQEPAVGPLRVLPSLISLILQNISLTMESRSLDPWTDILTALDRISKMLSTFGCFILNRRHNRLIMQPFLNTCLDWAEFKMLVSEYGPAEIKTDFNFNLDGLSCVHSYLIKDQWSVLSERITNFGDDLCNFLLILLELQRIRFYRLKVSGDVCDQQEADSLVLKMISNKSKLNLYEREDVLVVINKASEEKSYPLVENLVAQFPKLPSVFLSNDKFVRMAFEACSKKLISHVTSISEQKTMTKLRKYPNIDWEKFGEILGKELIGDKVKNFDIDEDEVNQCRRIMEQLPLPYISRTSGPKSTLPILALISVHETLLKKFLPTFYILLQHSENFQEYINLSICIEWTTKLDHPAKIDLIELLVKKAFGSEKGILQISQYVKKFKKVSDREHVFPQVALYQALRKCLVRSKKGESLNEEIAQQRRRLSKTMRTAIKSTEKLCDEDFALLEAYALELGRLIRLKKVDDIFNFNAFFDFCVEKITLGTLHESFYNFLNTILNSLDALRPCLPENAIKRIWNAILNHKKCDFSKLKFEKVGDFFSPEELETFLENLAKETFKVFENNFYPEEQFIFFLSLWRSWLKNPKTADATLRKLKSLFLLTYEQLPNFQQLHYKSSWIEFLSVCASKISTSPVIKNYLWDVLSQIPNSNLSEKVNLFLNLCHEDFRFDTKVPNVQIIFTNIVWDIAHHQKGQDVVKAAFLLEKWSKSLMAKKEVLVRVISFFISELIAVFSKVVFTESIKLHLENTLYNLYNIADEHVVEHLMRVLPAAQHKVFTNYYQNYKKFYKFKGKI